MLWYPQDTAEALPASTDETGHKVFPHVDSVPTPLRSIILGSVDFEKPLGLCEFTSSTTWGRMRRV